MGILGEYRSKDKCLDELIGIASKSPEIWQAHKDILVESLSHLPASHFGQLFRRRLERIPDEPDTEPIKAAIVRLVDYCTLHPDAGIYDVTFNCPKHSYTVVCGQTNEQLEVICVIVGKHIPEYALRR
jgi:hypothetical protein